eukprot:971133_1
MTIDPYVFKDITFTSVAQDTFISIICIDCSYITFNFSYMASTAITVIDKMSNCNVLGPQTLFQFSFMPHTQLAENIYHLEATERVIFYGLQECETDDAKSSYIYLSNQMHVEINDAIISQTPWCEFFDGDICVTGTIIYSSFGSDRTVLEENGWNITFLDDDQCILFEETPQNTTPQEMELSTLEIGLIIGGVVAVVALIGFFVLCWQSIKYKSQMKYTSQNEPGSGKSGSYRRTSTKHLDVNEEDENEDGEDNAEEESLVDDAKEGDGEDLEGNMVLNRQQTDERVA